MEEPIRNDLVVVVVGSGCTDTVMEAAKSAGARWGTILHGRRVDEEGDEGGLRPEKEIVAILTPRDRRQAILEAVNRAAGAATESHGVLFSLPVEHVMGLSRGDGPFS